MKKITILTSLVIAITIPVSVLAQTTSLDQEDAASRVLWRSEGRARPSRRAIKAKVFDDMKENATTFTNNQLERRRIQQQRTFNDLRSSKQQRNDESKDERIANQLSDRAEVLDRNNNRLQKRLSEIQVRTVRSVNIDVSKCNSLHVRARRMCIIDLRRDERIRLHRGEMEAVREEVDTPKEETMRYAPRVNRRLPTKPLSRRSTNSPQTGPAEIIFPDPVVETNDEGDQEDDQPVIESQTSG